MARQRQFEADSNIENTPWPFASGGSEPTPKAPPSATPPKAVVEPPAAHHPAPTLSVVEPPPVPYPPVAKTEEKSVEVSEPVATKRTRKPKVDPEPVVEETKIDLPAESDGGLYDLLTSDLCYELDRVIETAPDNLEKVNIALNRLEARIAIMRKVLGVPS